jgi:hypothetical protein
MRQRHYVFSALFIFTSGVIAIGMQGCGGSGDPSQFPPADNGNDGSASGDGTIGTNDGGPQPCFGGAACDGSSAETAPPCQGLQCQVNKKCPGGAKTSISGKVFDPAGKNPLYNVVVYVPVDPTGKLPPITPGTNTCNTCDANIGSITAATITDETGTFKLNNVPTGTQIPLVMQIGKWRREIILPATADCADTAVAAADTHLPRKKSEGDIPQMAVVTGGCDPLACLFSRIGLDASEFTNPAGAGRMHVYKGIGGGDVAGGGAGDCTGATCPLWTQKPQLEKYDIALLSCECDEQNQTKPNKVPMHDWVNEGGKVFATHFHYTWFKNGPADFAATANWGGSGNNSNPFAIDTTFPKGQAFVKWLQVVGATTNNTIQLNAGDVRDDLTTVNATGQRWVYAAPTGGRPEGDKYYTFNTPTTGLPPAADAGPDAGKTYCGKAVFSDIHVSGSNTAEANTVPTTCAQRDLTPQEKALEFLFFDLSSCVTNDKEPPVPPIPR